MSSTNKIRNRTRDIRTWTHNKEPMQEGVFRTCSELLGWFSYHSIIPGDLNDEYRHGTDAETEPLPSQGRSGKERLVARFPCGSNASLPITFSLSRGRWISNGNKWAELPDSATSGYHLRSTVFPIIFFPFTFALGHNDLKKSQAKEALFPPIAKGIALGKATFDSGYFCKYQLFTESTRAIH